MRIITAAVALGLAATLAGCQQAGEPTEVAQAHAIAWREGDVDDALAEAKELGKPVILYWGAVAAARMAGCFSSTGTCCMRNGALFTMAVSSAAKW